MLPAAAATEQLIHTGPGTQLHNYQGEQVADIKLSAATCCIHVPSRCYDMFYLDCRQEANDASQAVQVGRAR